MKEIALIIVGTLLLLFAAAYPLPTLLAIHGTACIYKTIRKR